VIGHLAESGSLDMITDVFSMNLVREAVRPIGAATAVPVRQVRR
jgi:hypothetical protein